MDLASRQFETVVRERDRAQAEIQQLRDALLRKVALVLKLEDQCERLRAALRECMRTDKVDQIRVPEMLEPGDLDG